MTNKQIKFPSDKAPIAPNVKSMLGGGKFLIAFITKNVLYEQLH
jgi:hypothetical protein